jgi:hypothetical protein
MQRRKHLWSQNSLLLWLAVKLQTAVFRRVQDMGSQPDCILVQSH